MVRAIQEVVNGLDKLELKDVRSDLQLITRTMFIHGTRSFVEFDFYNQKARKELGDIIFIISLVQSGRKCFEKMTINQMKKDYRKAMQPRWSIDEKQLFLLSRFPIFEGYKGSIIGKHPYHLLNQSGCLGSYGLLYKPGDFGFVSATSLAAYIGRHWTLKMPDFQWLRLQSQRVPLDPFDLLGNDHFSQNVFDFSERFLKLRIGEPIYSTIGQNNKEALGFLHELLSVVKNQPQHGDFVDDFFRYDYVADSSNRRETNEFGLPSGGVAIIHTTINLGESR